ncbi:hypothetical protein IWW36_006017, partial [Coemansia brasiliensis]
NRKTGRQDSRVHSSQNDSSATALQTHDAVPGARGAGSRPSPSPSTGTAQNGKGAADFRVQGLRNDTPPTSLTNSLPVLNRHEIGDEVAAPPAVPIHRQRRAKLIRDPSNTCHQRRNRASRFSQSMDFVRSQSTEFRQRHNRLSHLFSCCSPMSLFRRGTSYGSMRNDANQESTPDGHQEQQTQRLSGMHDDAGESLYGHEQMAERQHDDLPARGHHSATETAVAVGSLDDPSPESSKAPSTPSNGPQIVGAPEDTDDANESDWLVSRTDRERSSTNDYSSPGSGLPGVGGTYASAMSVPRSQAQASGLATYNSTYSDLDTDAGISTPGDSVYRTPPTSLGDMTNSTSNAQRAGGL